ncbi:hypothetical protein BDQ94DRAFT_81626 [Aspergillus welwitschiae]|uniref:Uncharacterized protein n=1 Tax=Aspergillus welwitschiae TaxID=1341132 RepID=A0A3F3PRW7_9EURO|nr:hypothetical protein BDQ94DRAFT_81626 [Aspergillus welwitschiae]RDH29603.1 hypothetical protein BDQ94DRAFT_81626 [Aspergillus welwitschiae]
MSIAETHLTALTDDTTCNTVHGSSVGSVVNSMEEYKLHNLSHHFWLQHQAIARYSGWLLGSWDHECRNIPPVRRFRDSTSQKCGTPSAVETHPGPVILRRKSQRWWVSSQYGGLGAG